MSNVKQDNFKRMAEARTNKIIDMIDLLGNLCNSSYYEYSDSQVEEIFNTIQNELDITRKKFDKDKNSRGNKRFEL
jgi:CHASE1-domain containing sensor protein